MSKVANQKLQECIDNCEKCHKACLETVTYCLSESGTHTEATHIKLLLDCAQICNTSSDFMIRASSFHQKLCSLCTEICKRCAEDCERIGNSDGLMKECANICRECAQSCQSMEAMAAV